MWNSIWDAVGSLWVLRRFKLEMNWNQEELEQWAIAARQKEEDLFSRLWSCFFDKLDLVRGWSFLRTYDI